MEDLNESRLVVKAERDAEEVSAAFAPRRADPCAPNFIRLCEDPTREEILINSLYVSLRGQVEDDSITQAEADRKLSEYRQRLEREPIVPGLRVFLSALALPPRDEILSKFPLEQYCADRGIKLLGNGPKRMCRCPLPGHEDKHPSCSVDLTEQLFYCHVCDKGGDVISLHAYRNGWEPKADFVKVVNDLCGAEAQAADAGAGGFVAAYDYRKADGALSYQKVRYPRGSTPRFRIRHKENGEWAWGQGGPALLYRLDKLVKAADYELVFVTEGEKDVETLEKLSAVATTSGGAKSWKESFAEFFKGRDVIICPDADAEGEDYCRAVGRGLLPAAASVRVVRLPPGLKDVTELYEDGPSAFEERFQQAVSEARPFAESGGNNDAGPDLHAGAQEPDGGNGDEAKFRELFRIKKLADMSRKLPTQIIEGVLYRGGKLLIGGGSKARKSFLLLHLAYCAANGLPWFGWALPRGKVLFINLELFESEAACRLDKIRETIGGDDANIEVACLRGKLTSVEDLKRHAAAIKNCAYQFIVIDPAYKLLGSRDENAAGHVADLLNSIQNMAEEANVAVAIAQHFSKGNQSMKEAIDRFCGSGVWGRDPDALIILTAHQEEDCYTADVILRSFKPKDPFVVRFEFPLFVVADDLDPGDLKTPPGKKAGTFEQKYTDEELAFPFRQPRVTVLTVPEWQRMLREILGKEVGRDTLYRRMKDPGFPVEKCGASTYRLKVP